MNKDELEKNLEEVDSVFGRINFFRNDLFLGRSLREYGEWAKKELDLLAMLIDSGGTVVDAGAYIGTHSMAFSHFVGSEGEVYSFEPHPTNFKLLQKNWKINRFKNGRLFNMGLSDRPGRMWVDDLNIQEANSFGSVKLEGNSSCKSKLAVDIITIDSLELRSCGLIKVDVEGMEDKVLAGGQKTIEEFKPFVYAECNSADASWPVVQRMREYGYKVYLYSEIAFNRDNYRKNPNNIFGDARELALVCVPFEMDVVLEKKLNQTLDIIPIDQLDDLVIALIKKPQYKQEVLVHTSGAKRWGNSFWANEEELQRTGHQIETLTQINDQLRLELDAVKTEAQIKLDSLSEWATSADAYGNSLIKELEKIREAYDAERSAREKERSDARKQIDALTEWATSADVYGKSLVEELEKIREAYNTERSARERERTEAQRQIYSLTEWATSADVYGKSLVEEIEKIREAHDVERSARKKKTD